MSHSTTKDHEPAVTHKARDKAHDTQLALALLLTDWLHGDRRHQDKLRALALDLLSDLGAEGEAAKDVLMGMATGA